MPKKQSPSELLSTSYVAVWHLPDKNALVHIKMQRHVVANIRSVLSFSFRMDTSLLAKIEEEEIIAPGNAYQDHAGMNGLMYGRLPTPGESQMLKEITDYILTLPLSGGDGKDETT